MAMQPAQLATWAVDAVLVLPDILAVHAGPHRSRQGRQILGVDALEQFMVGKPGGIGLGAMQFEETGAGEREPELSIRIYAELEQPARHLLRQPRKAPLTLQPHALAELALARQPQRQQHAQQQHGRAYAVAQQAALQRSLQRLEDGLLVQSCTDDQRIAPHPAPGIHALHAIDGRFGLVGAALQGRSEQRHAHIGDRTAHHLILPLRARQVGAIGAQQQDDVAGTIEDGLEVARDVFRRQRQHQHAREPPLAVQRAAQLYGPFVGDAPLHGAADEHAHVLAAGMHLEMLAVSDGDLGGPRLRLLLEVGVDDVPVLVGHGDLQEGAGWIGVERGLHGTPEPVGIAVGKVGLQAAHGVVQAGQQGLHLH